MWRRASLLTCGGSARPSWKASVEFEESVPGMLNTSLGSPRCCLEPNHMSWGLGLRQQPSLAAHTGKTRV